MCKWEEEPNQGLQSESPSCETWPSPQPAGLWRRSPHDAESARMSNPSARERTSKPHHGDRAHASPFIRDAQPAQVEGIGLRTSDGAHSPGADVGEVRTASAARLLNPGGGHAPHASNCRGLDMGVPRARGRRMRSGCGDPLFERAKDGPGSRHGSVTPKEVLQLPPLMRRFYPNGFTQADRVPRAQTAPGESMRCGWTVVAAWCAPHRDRPVALSVRYWIDAMT